MALEVRTVGVIGAGTMGNGIAQVFAAADYPVLMFDISEESLRKGIETIGNSLGRLLSKEKISAADKEKALARIRTVIDLSELSDCDLVVEAASEDLGIKTKIFQQLDQICKADTVLASNTSSISLTKIASVTDRPGRVIGMHFMNPVPLMKLVEIIRAMQTSDEVFRLIEDLSTKIGKIPVIANDSPGFVSNRILMPMINEAICTHAEGVATVEGIDQIMKLGMNHPIGPLALADLIGLDTCLAIMEVLYDGFGDSKYRASPLLRRMVDAGYLGRKTGKGFYEYN